MANQETKIVITAATAQAEAALKSFTGAFKGMIGVVGGAISVGAFANLIKSGIDLQDEFDNLSKKTGVSVKDLAGLKYAADQNGASLEVVAKAAKELAVNMSSTPDKFAKLGITANDATGALVQIADIVAQMPDGFQKTALLAELLGKKIGPEMADMLSQGGAALQQYISKGQQIYYVTGVSTQAAADFKDRMAELEARTQGLAIKLGNVLLPVLNDVAKAMLGTTGDPLKDLNIELETVRRNMKTAEGGGLLSKWLHGSKEELKAREQEILKEIARIKEEMSKAAAGGDKPKSVPAAVSSLLNADQKNGIEILKSLERDYQNELAKRKDALNAPLLSASERQLADDLRAVHKRAQDARVALEAQKAAAEGQGKTFSGYQERLKQITAEEQKQVKAVTELQAAQDKLNSTWVYGAEIAIRKYLDEATNTAAAVESVMTKSMNGMTDALTQFVKTGKADFRSLADSIISDLLRIQMQKAVAGIMGNLFGVGNGYSSSEAASAGMSLDSSYTHTNLYQPQSAGIQSASSASAAAGRSGGAVSVTVHNYSGQPATATETTDDRGNRRIEVVVGDMAASELARPGSAMHRTMRTSFGAQPAMVNR